MALVKQLLARNEELERKLGSKMKNNEGVSSAQLLMLLDEVKVAGDEKRKQADEKLRAASGIDEKLANLETEEPPSGPRCASRRRPTCDASRTRCWCRPTSGRARSVALSARASATR